MHSTALAEHAAVLLDRDRSPLEHREAALDVAAIVAAIGGVVGPISPVDGRPLVDVWRLMAWARSMAEALAGRQAGTRLLYLDGEITPLVVALAVTPALPVITLVYTTPKRARRAQAVLGALFGIEPEVRFHDAAASPLEGGVIHDPVTTMTRRRAA